MIKRVLGVNPDNLDYSVLERLVETHLVEDQMLEFKRDLPGSSDAAKKDFTSDVVAMANGGGGVIIYGIEETDDGAASSLSPFSLTGEVERLQQMINSRVEPFLPVKVLAISSGRDGEGCVLVVVHAPSRPYGAAVNSRWAFSRRIGRTIEHMSEPQIAQMYRDRFRRQADVRERFEELDSLCFRPEVDDALPQVSILGTPAEPASRLFHPDGATKHRIRSISAPRVLSGSAMSDPIPTELRSGFRRIDFAADFQPASLDKYGWGGFHDDGSCHRAIRGESVASNVSEMDGKPGFRHTWLTISVVTAVYGYGLLLDEFGIEGEVLIQARLADRALPAPLVPAGAVAYSLEPALADRPIETEAAVLGRDLASLPDALSVAKEILDDVFSAFSWESCPLISRDGSLVLHSWPGEWRSPVRAWAEAVGVAAS